MHSFLSRAYFLALFLLGVIPNSNAKIIKTSSLEPIKEAIMEADEYTLVIFDIDDTLIKCADPAGQTPHRGKLLYDKYVEIHGQGYKGPDYLMGYMWNSCGAALVDPEILTIFEILRENKVPTMALTAGWSGEFDEPSQDTYIPRLEVVRANRLAEVGLQFDWWLVDEEHVFETLKTHNHDPIFYKGVLFCCKIDKEKVLKEFLHKKQLLPGQSEKSIKKVIFVDDYPSNPQQLEQFCTDLGIEEYIGFHYTKMEEEPALLNEARAKKQFDHLAEHHVWLSDTEADAALMVY